MRRRPRASAASGIASHRPKASSHGGGTRARRRSRPLSQYPMGLRSAAATATAASVRGGRRREAVAGLVDGVLVGLQIAADDQHGVIAGDGADLAGQGIIVQHPGGNRKAASFAPDCSLGATASGNATNGFVDLICNNAKSRSV